MELRLANTLAVTLDKEPVTPERVERLLKERQWNNAQLARFIGVERWTVGAWINGTRSISEKHQATLKELIHSPKDSLPTLYPLTRKLHFEFRDSEDSEEGHVDKAVSEIVESAYRRFDLLGFRRISADFYRSLEHISQTHDDYSIAQLSELFSKINLERARIASMPAKEYVQEVVRLFPMDGTHSIEMELDGDSITSFYSLPFEIDEEKLDNDRELQIDCPDGDSYVDIELKAGRIRELKSEHEDAVVHEAETMFADTAFETYGPNDQWLAENIYAVCYTIQLDDPQLKESLSLLRRRMRV